MIEIILILVCLYTGYRLTRKKGESFFYND
nr:MAG TPA: FeoB-associated Cys-rich membrane protein [Caudoviricetes sp.]DAM07228.1 MAG TPA: FeoB-associated Cys-rich membrane protein [Caudoviricetes sp.]